MKKWTMVISVICIGLFFVLNSCSTKTTQLWNGEDFSGWGFVLEDDSVDVSEVWTIQEGVIHCTGIPNGYMRTDLEYSNYILYLDWRWPENESNSGILLHMQEPDQVWPICIECQLRAGRAGDFVLMGSGSITVDGETHNNTRQFLSISKKEESSENQIGEWNSYKIICENDKITCYVNDVLQNEGTGTSISIGKIGLQSEGGPIEFRNIRLESLL